MHVDLSYVCIRPPVLHAYTIDHRNWGKTASAAAATAGRRICAAGDGGGGGCPGCCGGRPQGAPGVSGVRAAFQGGGGAEGGAAQGIVGIHRCLLLSYTP